MSGEFTNYCNHYCKLTELLAKREERLQYLLNNPPVYRGQSRRSGTDAIIGYYRMVQAYKAKTDKIYTEMKVTKRTIMTMMDRLETPRDPAPWAEIPGQVGYLACADSDDAVHIPGAKNHSTLPDIFRTLRIKLIEPGAEQD